MTQLNKEILRLAVPSVLANLTIPLVSLVDVAISGHIADAAALAGIAVGTTLFDLLYWNFGFLRVGTAALTAQAYGRGERQECARTAVQSLSIAVAGALVVMVAGLALLGPALSLMHCRGGAAAFAALYFRIRIFASPATLALMALKGWFIGMQDTRTPMVSDMTVNGVNMVASFGLSVFTPLGAAGVAWGTVVAQYVGLVVTMVILVRRYGAVFSGMNLRLAWRGAPLGRFFSLNANLFVRSLCFMVVYVGFTRLTADYGTEQLAIGNVVMKLFMFFSYFIDGFAYAAEAMVGRAVGEGRRDKMQATVRALMLWALASAVVCTLLFGFWGNGMIRLITGSDALTRLARDLDVYLWLMPLCSAAAFLLDGIFVGAARGRDLAVAMIAAAVSFVAVYVLCRPMGSVHAVYIAYMAHLVARVAYLGARYPRIRF